MDEVSQKSHVEKIVKAHFYLMRCAGEVIRLIGVVRHLYVLRSTPSIFKDMKEERSFLGKEVYVKLMVMNLLHKETLIKNLIKTTCLNGPNNN